MIRRNQATRAACACFAAQPEFRICRYGLPNDKDHFACFACRKTYKKTASQLDRRRLAGEKKSDDDDARSVCPQCAGRMAKMGLDFKAPPQRGVEA